MLYWRCHKVVAFSDFSKIPVIIRTLITHLKRNLSKTSSTFDVETEDGQSHVQLILNRLFACIELLPLVDVLATCFTPANNQIEAEDTGLIHRIRKSVSLRASPVPTVNTMMFNLLLLTMMMMMMLNIL